MSLTRRSSVVVWCIRSPSTSVPVIGHEPQPCHQRRIRDCISSVAATCVLLMLASAIPALAQTIDGGTTVNVPGDRPTPWNTGSSLSVGSSGTGTLNILGGGIVSNNYGYIGNGTGSNGRVTVDGTDVSGNASTWTNSGNLTVGADGTGTLIITNGGVVTSAGGRSDIGYWENGNGTVDVDGTGSKWSISGYLTVGLLGAGSLSITNGGAVSNSMGYVGNKTGAYGTVTVDGAGSTWTNSMILFVGTENGSRASLNITNGGVVVSNFGGNVANNAGSVADITVDGHGSKWTMTYGDFEIGRAGTGTMSITNGGVVSDVNGNIANNPTGIATVTVDGVGSTWTNSGNLYVAAGAIYTVPSGGTGTLNISNGGTVSAVNVQLGSDTGGRGIINIGAGQGFAAVAPGTLDVLTLNVKNYGSLVFNHTSTDYVFNPQIIGGGNVNQLAGTTVLTGNSGAFSGATSVIGGALLVNGTLGNASSTVGVSSGGTLGGNGTIGGNVTIADGNLSPGFSGSPSVLTIGGNLVLGSTSILNYQFGEAGAVGGSLNDLTVVNGNLTLDGRLNVTVPTGGSFDPGVYRIFNYGGALFDNVLTLGTMPSGNFSVETAITGQVDLVYTSAGMTLTFWDGDLGPKGNHIVDGGNGTWRVSASDNNWTNLDGFPNAPYQNGSFAVFAGAAGTVTVDNSTGQVVSGGMQFMTNGYVIQGGAITMADGSNIIRVGDGTRLGTDFVATIASELTGNGGIDKHDVGTLVLTGTNSYTGGTTITSGTLQLGNGGASGSILGDVLDNGTLAFNRSDAVTFGGVISGSGAVDQIGPGTTALTSNNNTYSGATNVVFGTLQAGAANVFSPNSAVNVASAGTLDLDGFSQTVAGLANAGWVNMGSGTLPTTVLTVNGNYVGNGGTISLNTFLGANDSPSDMLVVNGNTSGATNLHIANAGGLGARTTGNGIEVIEVNGASNGLFSLTGRVAAGAYDYNLFHNGVDVADGNWYLRSSLRPEVPVDTAMPALVARMGLAMMGEGGGLGQFCLETAAPAQEHTAWQEAYAAWPQGRSSEPQGPPTGELSGCRTGMWGRVFGETGTWGANSSDRTLGYGGPAYSFTLGGFQSGADLYHTAHDNAGLFAGAGRLDSTIRGLDGGDAGKVGMDSYAAGGYWSHHGPGGWYADLAVQGLWYENLRAATFGGMSISTSGTGFAVSGKTGYWIALGGGYFVVPQTQLIYQHTNINGAVDAFSQINFGAIDELYARLGVRLTRDWATNDGSTVTTWVDVNLWRQFGGDATTTFSSLQGANPTTFEAGLGDTWAQLRLGLSGNVTRNLSIFGGADYNVALNQPGHSLGGRAGIKVHW